MRKSVVFGVLVLMGSMAHGAVCPDGTRVAEDHCVRTPNGKYVGSSDAFASTSITPSGNYVVGDTSNLAPNGKYVSGDDNKRCSDGSYVGIHERCS